MRVLLKLIALRCENDVTSETLLHYTTLVKSLQIGENQRASSPWSSVSLSLRYLDRLHDPILLYYDTCTLRYRSVIGISSASSYPQQRGLGIPDNINSAIHHSTTTSPSYLQLLLLPMGPVVVIEVARLTGDRIYSITYTCDVDAVTRYYVIRVAMPFSRLTRPTKNRLFAEGNII